MTWMNKWAGGTLMYLASAHGNRITDVDGEHLHRLRARRHGRHGRAPRRRPPWQPGFRRGGELAVSPPMLPTEDAQWVAAELTRRFRMPKRSFTLSASDANRWALRIGRDGHRPAQGARVQLQLSRIGG